MESADTIKSVIESTVCPVHDVHPIVDTEGNKLKISCCCAQFYEECTGQVKGLFMTNKYPYWTLA